jgi:tetratricopeptide (TPR) repeat protein
LRGGPLQQVDALLRQERVAGAADRTVAELQKVNRQLEVLASATPGGGYFDAGAEMVAVATHMLPADVSSFTGRAAQLERLMGALAEVQDTGNVVGISAIDGMAGVGKSAFAVRAAYQLASRFPDGQFFVRLHGHTPGQRPVEPAEALASLLRSIGVHAEQVPARLEDRAALWRDRMASKKALVLLDDASGTEQVRPLLPGTSRTLVLITSRRRLATLPEAVAITLDILEQREAAVLLVRLAGRSDLRPSTEGIADVTKLCGYLPLAISLMAGQLRHHPSWSVIDLASDLAAAKNRIAALRAEDVSVAAAFDLSYKDLNSDEQRLFRRLGLHPGPDLDAYAAAALDDTDLVDVRVLLNGLYDFHLIAEPTYGRYRMHDLLREHAQILAASDEPADRAAAIDRLLDYYLHTARLADRQLARRTHTSAHGLMGAPPRYAPELASPVEAISWMEAEQANLLAAVDSALLHGRPSPAVGIPIAMHGFLRTYGRWDQALAVHQLARAAAHQAGDRLGEAETLNNLAVIQRLKRDEAAVATLNRAVELYRDIGNRLGEANVLSYLGVLQRLKHEYPAAVATLTEALHLQRDVGNRLGTANSLNYLGVTQRAIGDYSGAIASQEQALEHYETLGDRLGMANALIDLGVAQKTLRAGGSYREHLTSRAPYAGWITWCACPTSGSTS